MLIAQCITRAHCGGSQTDVLTILRGLAGKVRQRLIVGEEGWLTEEARKLNVDVRVVHLVRDPSPFRDVLAVGEMVWACKDTDLIHAHTAKAGFMARIAGSCLRRPVVYCPHGWCFSSRNDGRSKRLYAWVERAGSVFTNAIIAVSEEDKRLALQNGISRNKVWVVENGLYDDCPLGDAGNTTGERLRAIMVARFAPPKDYATLLRAVSLMKQECDLWLVGDGPLLRPMQALAEDLRLSDRVQFWGERRDAAQLIARCHIAVLSSRWEVMGLAAVEGMRASIPVIATNVGGVKYVVDHERTGLLVAPEDPVAMAGALDRLACCAAFRTALGSAGRRRFLERFRAESMVARLAELYEGVLKGPICSLENSPQNRRVVKCK